MHVLQMQRQEEVKALQLSSYSSLFPDRISHFSISFPLILTLSLTTYAFIRFIIHADPE
jgi:hypothetical protein